MITFKQLNSDDIKDPWLSNALTKGLKECLMAPIIGLGNITEVVRRTEMIIENFSRDGFPAVPTVVSPGNMIQFIMPFDEILMTILFLREKMNTRVQVVIQKLNTLEEDEDGQL